MPKIVTDEMRFKAKTSALRLAEKHSLKTDGRHMRDTGYPHQPACYVAAEGEARTIVFYETDPEIPHEIISRPGRLVPFDQPTTTAPLQNSDQANAQ